MHTITNSESRKVPS